MQSFVPSNSSQYRADNFSEKARSPMSKERRPSSSPEHRATPQRRANPTKPRVFKPKVRTGCITCKYRRVKCDEAKPLCNRCTKFGVVCGGYATDVQQQSSRLIQPKNEEQTSQCFGSPPIDGRQQSPHYNDLNDAQVHQYCVEAAGYIRMVLNNSLWDQHIFSAYQRMPHIVTALGALSRACRESGKFNADCGSLRPRSTISDHPDYTLALHEYERALQCMRIPEADWKRDVKRALDACFLIFCFESLQDNRIAALAQVRGGLEMWRHWLQRMKSDVRTCNSPSIDEATKAFLAMDQEYLVTLSNIPQAESADDIDPDLYLVDEFKSFQQAQAAWWYLSNRGHRLVLLTHELANATRGSASSTSMREFPEWNLNEVLHHESLIDRWLTASSTLFAEIELFGSPDIRASVSLMQAQAMTSKMLLAEVLSKLDYEAVTMLGPAEHSSATGRDHLGACFSRVTGEGVQAAIVVFFLCLFHC